MHTQSISQTRTCEVCQKAFKPRNQTSRFCGHPCRQVWWQANVQAKATAKGAAQSKVAMVGARKHDPVTGRFLRTKAQKRGAQDEPPRLRLSDDAEEWTERAMYWDGLSDTRRSRLTAFGEVRPPTRPLVLNGHGVKLNVHYGALVIRNGFTHYPQENPEIRLYPSDRDLPPRIVLLDSDGVITFDALKWLARNHIPLVQLDWQGLLLNVINGSDAPPEFELWRRQFEAIENGTGVELSRQLIRQKIEGCRSNLESLWKCRERDLAIKMQDMALVELKSHPISYDRIRIIEAQAASAYFSCWSEQPIRWKGTARRPIPADWHRYGSRQGILYDRHRHATHPVNALMNYCYSILESELRIAVSIRGLDPRIGYLHTMRPGRTALVYDLMEPLRPVMDRHVLDFVRGHTFSPSDFEMTDRGVCRLHPQLARRFTSSIQIEELTTQPVDQLATALQGMGQ